MTKYIEDTIDVKILSDGNYPTMLYSYSLIDNMIK